MLLLTSLSYFLVLSVATMISLDEIIFLMSFFRTCWNMLDVFLSLVLYFNETKSYSNKSHCTLAPAHAPCLFSIDLHTVGQHLVIVHFLLLLLLSGTLFQMMSGVPHHCHHPSLVWRHYCFVQFTKTELYPWPLYICAWFGLVIPLLMVFLENALMCAKKSN